MTKPTQEQVEALKALLPGYEQYLEWAKERRVLFLHNGYEALEKAKDAITTLTTAAQVGEQDLSGGAFTEWAWRDRNATIERCAQVAEKAVLPSDLRPECIAAAIRKLKEQS